MKALYLALVIALSGCAVGELLKPADPCASEFSTPITVNQCRVELGIQAEAGRIEALANATARGDTEAQAKLQKRLDRLKQFKKNKVLADTLLNDDPVGAEAQLDILRAALEKVANEQ